MILNVAGGNRDGAGSELVFAPTGGSFSAYLSSLQLGIGAPNNRSGAYWPATMDLTNTELKTFDVVGDVQMGGAPYYLVTTGSNAGQSFQGTGRGQGELILPAVSARIGGNLDVDLGGTYTERYGRLVLHGTQLTVEGEITLGENGTITCVMDENAKSGDWFLCATSDEGLADDLEAGKLVGENIPYGANFGVWNSRGMSFVGLLPPAGTIVILQ